MALKVQPGIREQTDRPVLQARRAPRVRREFKEAAAHKVQLDRKVRREPKEIRAHKDSRVTAYERDSVHPAWRLS